MTWLEALPAVAVAIALFIVPGAPFSVALGLRGIAFLGVSIGASVAVVAGASILAPFVGLEWSLLPVGAAALLAGLVGLALRPLARRRQETGRSEWRTLWPALGGVAFAAVLILAFLLPSMESPRNPSQTYDALYHLNAIRWIADGGEASPFRMTMTTPGSPSFYPLTWHGIAVLVLQVSGAEPVVAANALALVVAAFAWPVASAFLTRMVFGDRPLAVALGGALSAGFAMFPSLLVWYGVLYPNALAFAIVPVALGSVVGLLRGGARVVVRRTPAGGEPDGASSDPPHAEAPDRAGLSTVGWAAASVVAVGAATISHPNALFALFVLTAPLVVAAAVRGVREHRRPVHRLLVIGGAAAVLVVEAVFWSRFGTGDNIWPAARPFYVSVREALVNGPLALSVGYAATALVLLGVVAAVRRRVPVWLVASYLLTVLLFAFANGWPEGPLRTAITGLWYNDAFRLAALLPITAVPLAAAGLVLLLEWVGAWLERLAARRDGRPSPAVRTGVASAVAVLAVLATQFGAIQSTRADLEAAYRIDERSPAVNPDELRLFEDVADLTPEDAVIAGNPWNGSALAYAFTGREVLFPHVGGRYTEAHWAVARGLADADPAACHAAQELGVTHVIDSDGRMLFLGDARAELYPGLTDLPRDPEGLTLVAERGDARLYEVTGC
ncbi:DUF6541 family protein [Agromyces sp. NPDC056523]|uniref:DUF6541 family protein n=1 Tax=Agromyces sp. NPDC056523 TaxID=3345850 RepID=UPI00366B826C